MCRTTRFTSTVVPSRVTRRAGTDRTASQTPDATPDSEPACTTAKTHSATHTHRAKIPGLTMRTFPSADAPSGRRRTFRTRASVSLALWDSMKFFSVRADCCRLIVMAAALVTAAMPRRLMQQDARPFRHMPTFTTTILRRTWRAGRMFHSIRMRAPRLLVRSGAVPLDGAIHNSS